MAFPVPGTPRTVRGVVSTANTNLDGTGTLDDLLSGGANGTWIGSVCIKAIATTAADIVRFFVYDGTNTDLLDEVLVTAITLSGVTLAAYEGVWVPPQALFLPSSSWHLKVSTHAGQTYKLLASVGDL